MIRTQMPAKIASSHTPRVAGVHISHPDRLIYADQGISKVQLARYYESIADWIVPHVKGRPLTLVHCPAGIASPCIYLKRDVGSAELTHPTGRGSDPGDRQSSAPCVARCL